LKKASPQQVTHLPPLCGIFCLPWHRHSGTRNLCFTSHSKDEEIEVKWLAQGHKRGGLWRVKNPRCSDHESDTLTTRLRRPSSGILNVSWTLKYICKVIVWKVHVHVKHKINWLNFIFRLKAMAEKSKGHI
jgi:hypothetical protein